MAKKLSRFQKMRVNAQALLDEPELHSDAEVAKWRRFVHFWVMVSRSFVRNRCPVRASALAYATLLALIPMLAVVMSVTSTFLKQEGEARIDQFIVKLVSSVTPPDQAGTNAPAANPALASETVTANGQSGLPAAFEVAETNAPAGLKGAEAGGSPSALTGDQKAERTRKEIARRINEYIQRTRSGALGVTGSVLLIFAAISMLSRIETTFNDIWGVPRGRSWFMRIVLYWGVMSLGPLLLIVALGLTTSPHLETTKRLLASLPFVGQFILDLGFHLLPIVVLCTSFGLFYMLMPNAKVHWRAALAGGLVGGLLFHLNNAVSVLYVSSVVKNSKIYGSLGMVPVFMIGLYFSWLILLFGAQVAYAFQNRSSYLEARQIENINQRGREFIALRLMTLLGQRYLQGEPPPGVLELTDQLGVPSRLIREIMQPLAAARLVVETAGAETGYLPARPMDNITCHDILLALRASQGQELATRDEPTRPEVYGEFRRIQQAERQAASAVTMLALVNRVQAQAQSKELQALPAAAGEHQKQNEHLEV